MCMISFLHITAQHSLAFLTSFLLRPKWVIFELAFLPIISLSVGVARNENVHRERVFHYLVSRREATPANVLFSSSYMFHGAITLQRISFIVVIIWSTSEILLDFLYIYFIQMWLFNMILLLGSDRVRGFVWVVLKPNREHGTRRHVLLSN